MFFVKDNSRRGWQLSVFVTVMAGINVCLYIIMVELIKKYYAPFAGFTELSPDLSLSTLRSGLWAVAVVEVLFIVFLRRFALSRVWEESPNLKQIIQRLIILSMMTVALIECLSIYGLVFFLFTGAFVDFYVLAALSLFLFWRYCPRYSNWEMWVTEKWVTEGETS